MNPFHLPDAELRRLADTHGTPLYVVSRSKLIDNFRTLDAALPAVTLFYAVKANPQPEILSILHRAGAGFDVASLGEIEAALAAGADPREDLIFADTVKDPRHIAEATRAGLDDFTFDNPSELTQIARHAPGANVLVRIRVSNHGSAAHLSEKFGCLPDEAVPLLARARASGLRPRGVSFHVGSQCLEPQRYVEALDLVRGIFDGAAREGMALEMVDIGGGFPVRYRDEQIDLAAIGRTISERYAALFDPTVQLVAEPGRAVVGDAVCLITRVISESQRDGRNWLYCDDGTYGSFLEVLLYRQTFPLRGLGDGPTTDYVLAGPTCDSIDVWSRDDAGAVAAVALPELHLDDLIVAGSMGAYTFSEATRFNGFPPPGFVFVD